MSLASVGPFRASLSSAGNIWTNKKYFSSFAYKLAVWSLFGQNSFEIIVHMIFVLDFVKFVN